MKKIFILFLALTTMVGFYSCNKNENQVVLNPSNITPPVINAPTDSTSLIISQNNQDSSIIFSWSPASYGFNTVINYYIQMAVAGNNFGRALTLGSTKSITTLSVSYNDLNNKLLLMEINPEDPLPLNVEFRVISLISSQVDTITSNIITMTLTPFYIPIVYPQLYLPGAYQDWSPSTADSIGSINSDANYEGYIYLNVATEFKFTSARDWKHINYGNGGSAGNLSIDNGAGNLSVADSGFYKFNVNTIDLTWTSLKTTWALIGDATPGGSSTDTPMHYSPASQLWTVTVNLTTGKFKFRANGSDDLNYGSNAQNGMLQADGTGIEVSSGGNYTITLNLSHTVYKYQIVKN